MPFIANLPTWINLAEVYDCTNFPPAATFVDNLEGQLYFNRRGPTGASLGEQYYLYPRDRNILLEGSQLPAGHFHVLRLEAPTGSAEYVGYIVDIVHPRWLGFPNEHLAAKVSKLSHATLTSLGLD